MSDPEAALTDGSHGMPQALRRGKPGASTTLKLFTPITLACESTTAFLFLAFPIAQVAEPWYTVLKLLLMRSQISASVCTCDPGKYSGPITICCIAGVAKHYRACFYVAMAPLPDPQDG